MKFNDKQIDELRLTVGECLSGHRFRHTLGVEKIAVILGECCMPDKLDVIRVAALLHDISKEYSEAEHILLMKRQGIDMSEEDLSSPQLWHSMTAPLVVMEDFPEFACEEVLSAVRNHTVGSPDMSVLDEIILLADYIEFGRSYEGCVALRKKVFDELEGCEGADECVAVLHSAVAESLDNNIKEFTSRGKPFHSRTKLTRDAILAKIER